MDNKKEKMSTKKKIGIGAIIILVLAALGGTSEEAVSADTTTESETTQVAEDTKADDTAKAESTEEPAKTEPEVSQEYKNALKSAETYTGFMHMSKDATYDQLISEYGDNFPEDAAQYAVDNVEADWNANALASAETYYETMGMSKDAIYDQLISDYGDQFTEEQAQYAVDNLE